METKKCKYCQKELTEDIVAIFRKNGTVRRRNYCKKCAYEEYKKWLSENQERGKELANRAAKKFREKEKKIWLEKRRNKTCITCGTKLIDAGNTLAFYCVPCKKEKIKEWKRASYARNLDTVKKYNIKNKERIRKVQNSGAKKRRETLHSYYLRKTLKEKRGFTNEDIKQNPELIEIQKLIIQTKRL